LRCQVSFSLKVQVLEAVGVSFASIAHPFYDERPLLMLDDICPMIDPLIVEPLFTQGLDYSLE
jgi:hypothetical protein